MLSKNLKDVVVGSRSAKNPKEFLTLCLGETKSEIIQPDKDAKYNAILKILHFYYERINVEWGGFHVLELFSSPRFIHKRLGYLVGSLILPKNKELVIMTPSQLKKDFKSKNMFEICSAIHFASAVCIQDLCFCIEDDLQRLITYSKPCVRKRACILCRKVLLQSKGELAEKIAPMLLEKLKDDDTGVLIAAATSISDCALYYPKFFLAGIPDLYKLLEHKNNWLVIKALQVLCAMLTTETRLYTKLGKKILDILDITKALSVELEILKQIVRRFREYPDLITKAKAKISNYIENSDANIRYTGLLVLKKLLQGSSDLLIVFKDKLVKLFVSGDNAIKTRTLEIISENCTSETFQEIAEELIPQMEGGSQLLREEIINTLLKFQKLQRVYISHIK